MSIQILIIPEDPTYNGYILEPIVSRILEKVGKPNAKVKVLPNPKTAGYEHAKKLLVEQVLERYSHYDLLLFLPDADGKDRHKEFERLEKEALKKGVNLFCCAAKQEVEIWLLSGHLAKLNVRWEKLRAEVSIKEKYFAPFLNEHGDVRRIGGGRDLLMNATLQNYSGLLQRCPELAELEEKIRTLLMKP